MKKISLGVVGGLTLACCMSVLPVRVQAQASAAAPDSVAARSQALSALFTEIWEDGLTHSPEFASSIGDKRYDDQLTDYSVQEVNASLARVVDTYRS